MAIQAHQRASGTPDYFLKLGDIKGESQDDKHRDEMQVESWSFGLSQAGSFGAGSGGGSGKVSFEEINFMMRSNVATPRVFVASATGEHIEKAVLTCRKSGGKLEDFFVITMSDVVVSRLRINGPDGNPESRDIQPYDQFSLSFARIELAYKGQDSKGSLGAAVKGGYDLQRNVKI